MCEVLTPGFGTYAVQKGCRMIDTAMALGLRIRHLREDRGLTQEQLAERAGLSMKHLGLVERGKTNSTLSSLEGVSRALGVSLSDLFDFEHERLGGEQLADRVGELLESAGDGERQLIYRLVKAVVK